MSENHLILYTTEDGEAQFVLQQTHGAIWLSQQDMAELYQVTPQAITQHIRAIYKSGELAQEATCKEYLQVQNEGVREVRRSIKHYCLPMILAVGYRVRSVRGTQFRQWATRHLSEYITKGFVMDDERLKNPQWDYFDELLERIRDIRASEKRFYQKVCDLFASTSVDYDKQAEEARLFFQTIQNKMLYATTGKTAAELIVSRADSNQPNMGLKSWRGGRVRKGDVTISKNYLHEDEVRKLNRLTTMFLDFAEDRAEMKQQITMQEWIVQADRFLAFNERDVLTHAGKVSHQRMEAVAHEHYQSFDAKRKEAERLKAEAQEVEDTLHAIEQAERMLQEDKHDS